MPSTQNNGDSRSLSQGGQGACRRSACPLWRPAAARSALAIGFQQSEAQADRLSELSDSGGDLHCSDLRAPSAWKGSLKTRCCAVKAVNHRVTVVE